MHPPSPRQTPNTNHLIHPSQSSQRTLTVAVALPYNATLFPKVPKAQGMSAGAEPTHSSNPAPNHRMKKWQQNMMVLVSAAILNWAEKYHWRELPQGSFLSRQKSFVDKYLSQQTRACHNKTHLLSRQKYKHNFVATSILLSRQKMCFVMTNTCLSRQKWYLWQLPPVIENRWEFRFLLSRVCRRALHGLSAESETALKPDSFFVCPASKLGMRKCDRDEEPRGLILKSPAFHSSLHSTTL